MFDGALQCPLAIGVAAKGLTGATMMLPIKRSVPTRRARETE